MKKLLALTAVVWTSIGLATACNGVEAAAMFMDLNSSIDIEANYLTMSPNTPTLLTDGFAQYSDKMLRTIENVKATKTLFDHVSEGFNFNDLGKKQTGEITINSNKYQTEAELTNLSGKDGYALMFRVSDDTQESSVYIALEKANGFVNATMYQYTDVDKDGTFEMEMYSKFTKNSYTQVYFNKGKWGCGTISKNNDETTFVSTTVGTPNESYAGITNKEIGQIFNGTTHYGFNADGTANQSTGLDTKVQTVLTDAKLGEKSYSTLTNEDVSLHLAGLVADLY